MENNSPFVNGENKIFIGNIDKLSEWIEIDNENTEKIIDRIRLLIKNYLELDNVSFLFGSGSSIHLGAISIRNFPKAVEEHIKRDTEIYNEFFNIIMRLQCVEKPEDIIREGEDIKIEFEQILNYLIAKDYLLDEEKKNRTNDSVKKLISAIKEGLFNVCNVDKLPIPKDKIKKEYLKNVEENKYHFHEKFLKSLLQRPLNLKRANIFTLNYDLAFEYAFDKLGIHYIDGFAGFHKRYFRPETFEYDMFYPGSTTAGKVQRIEKLIRYFKLHGSISWVKSEKRDANNLYGIEELPLPLIEELDKKGEVIIYPSAVKKSYSLDFPYSELVRHFAATITQPQSVLITIGYSFADEHINDIIFQALSNPSFTLIILAYESNKHIERIKNFNDSRIIIIEGNYLADFVVFADKLMPDFYDIKSREKIAKTLNNYFDNDYDKSKNEIEE